MLTAARLYAIVDLGYVAPVDIEVAALGLIAGGADLIQLRAKGHAEGEIEAFARRLLPLCREAGVPLIVNDFPEIAARIGGTGSTSGRMMVR